MRFRKSAAAALAGVAIVAGLTATPSSAMASGGGCIDYSDNGWNVGACSSDNGTRVFGDLYVNSRGRLGRTCLIEFWIQKVNGDSVPYRKDGCYRGHHSAISEPMDKGCYYTWFNVIVDGIRKNTGTSPESCKK